MPDPLSLEDQVIAALRRITRAIDLQSRLLLKRYGITVPQLAALQAIERSQPVAVGAIARQIHLGQATVTGILGRLEKQGYVVRSRGSTDRRSVLVELTGDGLRVVRDAPSPLQERLHEALSQLQEWEQTMILATLQRIAAMIDVEQLEAAPGLSSVVTPAAEEISRCLGKGVLSVETEVLAEEFLDEAAGLADETRNLTSNEVGPNE